jgi:hypothetical protein
MCDILGRALAVAGQHVTLGSRHPDDEDVADGTPAVVSSVEDALGRANVVWTPDGDDPVPGSIDPASALAIQPYVASPRDRCRRSRVVATAPITPTAPTGIRTARGASGTAGGGSAVSIRLTEVGEVNHMAPSGPETMK